MKRVISGLFIFMMFFSFAFVAAGATTRTDFYIQDEQNPGGYEEDPVSNEPIDFGKSRDWVSTVIFWGIVIVAIGIVIKILQMISSKKSKPKHSKKRKAKKSRRKKK